MERNHGSLPEGWEVHHLNGVKSDNRPENLAGLPGKKHKLVLQAMQLRIRRLELSLSESRAIVSSMQAGQAAMVMS